MTVVKKHIKNTQNCVTFYRVRQKSSPPNIFCSFLSNRLEFKHKILHTFSYLMRT